MASYLSYYSFFPLSWRLSQISRKVGICAVFPAVAKASGNGSDRSLLLLGGTREELLAETVRHFRHIALQARSDDVIRTAH
jgi:hypothetical protein